MLQITLDIDYFRLTLSSYNRRSMGQLQQQEDRCICEFQGHGISSRENPFVSSECIAYRAIWIGECFSWFSSFSLFFPVDLLLWIRTSTFQVQETHSELKIYLMLNCYGNLSFYGQAISSVLFWSSSSACFLKSMASANTPY